MAITYLEAQTKLLELLEPLKAEFNADVKVFPDDWSISGKPWPRNLVLIAFNSEQCNTPAYSPNLSERFVHQVCTASFDVIVQTNSLISDTGSLALLQRCKELISGNRLHAEVGQLYCNSANYVKHDNRYWVYSLAISYSYKQSSSQFSEGWPI